MNEIVLFDGTVFDINMSLDGVMAFVKMSFNLYSADGTTHIGVGWFAVLGWLLLINMAKRKRGRRS